MDRLTYEQCVAQGVGPMVFPARLEKGIDSAHSAQMKAVCVQNMQQHVKLQHILEQAWTALTKAGIEPVLMKGAGLAALYPSPEMRTWGDIDLFVGKDQYHPACAVMRETFPNARKFDEELEHYKHYNLIADGISIEVHRVSVGLQHPIDAMRYARMERAGFQNACELEIGDLRLKIFEPTFNALFVFMHAWEHMLTQGANVRQLIDLKLLLQHYKDRIDRKRLKRWLYALHLTEVWEIYMYVLVHELGLPQGEAPLYKEHPLTTIHAEELVAEMIHGGERLGVSGERVSGLGVSGNRFVRKWHTMKERLRNADRIYCISPEYADHMKVETLLHGALRLFAKDRHWE